MLVSSKIRISSKVKLLSEVLNLCRPYAEKYAIDQDEFFKDYVEAHTKLSELGVKWTEGGPVNF